MHGVDWLAWHMNPYRCSWPAERMHLRPATYVQGCREGVRSKAPLQGDGSAVSCELAMALPGLSSSYGEQLHAPPHIPLVRQARWPHLKVLVALPVGRNNVVALAPQPLGQVAGNEAAGTSYTDLELLVRPVL